MVSPQLGLKEGEQGKGMVSWEGARGRGDPQRQSWATEH
jgi:hypothetical protein